MLEIYPLQATRTACRDLFAHVKRTRPELLFTWWANSTIASAYGCTDTGFVCNNDERHCFWSSLLRQSCSHDGILTPETKISTTTKIFSDTSPTENTTASTNATITTCNRCIAKPTTTITSPSSSPKPPFSQECVCDRLHLPVSKKHLQKHIKSTLNE